MIVNGVAQQSIWTSTTQPAVVQIIDQRFLPHEFVVETLTTVQEVAVAIRAMHLRGAPLIGVAAAYGMYLASIAAEKKLASYDQSINEAAQLLKATRPTAVNLAWAVDQVQAVIHQTETIAEKSKNAFALAEKIRQDSIERCRKIGEFGLSILQKIAQQKEENQVINILTHCNAGWLACVDYGTATAPIYAAHDAGIPIHVWVDETRPRNQGARLTAWELGQHQIPHTVIPDNVGGHLMQHGQVDLVLVGSDRTTYTGDVANKVGTYLKALAAKANEVPFYVALPASTFDWTIRDGLAEIPIEQRGAEEVRYIQGWVDGSLKKVLLTPENSPASNYAFDVTPAHLVTGLITERGICAANEKSILALFPEQKATI